MASFFKRITTVLYWSFFFLISLGLLTVAVGSNSVQVQLNVARAHGAPDTLQRFQQASVVGPGSIVINHPSPAMQYLAPATGVADPLYAALLLCTVLLFALFFHDFTYKQPFTRKALMGLRVVFWMLLLFTMANFWRHDWLTRQVSVITHQQYYYTRPIVFVFPEYWIGIVVLRLVWVFKKGVALQYEADLTV